MTELTLEGLREAMSSIEILKPRPKEYLFSSKNEMEAACDAWEAKTMPEKIKPLNPNYFIDFLGFKLRVNSVVEKDHMIVIYEDCIVNVNLLTGEAVKIPVKPMRFSR